MAELAAVYVWTPVNRANADTASADHAGRQVGIFARNYGYQISERYHDADPSPLSETDSAFAAMLARLAGDHIRYVLVPSLCWLAPTKQAQDQMAEMIAAHGGKLIVCDQATPGITQRATANPR